MVFQICTGAGLYRTNSLFPLFENLNHIMVCKIIMRDTRHLGRMSFRPGSVNPNDEYCSSPRA